MRAVSSPTDSDGPRPLTADMTRDAAVAAVGAALANLAGHGDLALGVTAAALAPTLPMLAAELDRVAGGSVTRMLARLLHQGEPPDALELRLSRLLAAPRTALLVRRAALAAASTVDEDKLRLLGQALRQVADDPARFDDELLLIIAITDFEPVHVQLLHLVADDRREAEPPSTGQSHWLPHELVERSGGRFSPADVAALLQPLALRACVETVGTYGGGYGYLLAPLGRRLLNRLDAAMPDDEGNAT